MTVELVTTSSPEIVEAMEHLIPQLSLKDIERMKVGGLIQEAITRFLQYINVERRYSLKPF